MSVTAILGASLSNENKIRLRWRKAPRREPAAGRRLASNPLAVLLTALESLPNLIGNKKAIRGQACTRPRFPIVESSYGKVWPAEASFCGCTMADST